MPAFLLALLPNARRYQPGFLRRALLFCVPAGVITAGTVLAVDFMIRANGTWELAESQTAIALLLGMTGLWVLTTLSFPLSPARLGILGGMVVMALGIFLIPIVSDFFGFAILTSDKFLPVALAGLVANALMTIVARAVDLRNPQPSLR